MIRQAISCDICASEKKQTNHWFVAHEQGGELRVAGWNSRNRLRPGSKHLCGQTCLHKLVDEFMARILANRVQPSASEFVAEQARSADASLTSNSAYVEVESSARLISPPTSPQPSRPPFRPQPELVAMPQKLQPEEISLLPGEPSRYPARNRRAEAWERERERTLSAVERRPDSAARRRSSA